MRKALDQVPIMTQKRPLYRRPDHRRAGGDAAPTCSLIASARRSRKRLRQVAAWQRFLLEKPCSTKPTPSKLLYATGSAGVYASHGGRAGSRSQLGQISGLGWHFLARQDVSRQPHEVLVESHLREALIRLNPEIAAQPERGDDVLYKLRAIVMGVRDGWSRQGERGVCGLAHGERSMPFGGNGEHVTVRLIDFADPEQNQYVVTPVHVPCWGDREARRPGAAGQRHTAGRDRGEDPGAPSHELGRRGAPGPRRLRAQRAGALRPERVLGRHRGQGAPLRLDPHAGRALGALARRRRRRSCQRWPGRAGGRVDARPALSCSTCWPTSRPFATDKKNHRIKVICSLPAVRGAPTGSSSASSPEPRRG